MTKAKIKEILGAEIVEKLTAQEGVVVKAVDRGLKDKESYSSQSYNNLSFLNL